MKVVFMGTADFGVPTLDIIHQSDAFEIAGIVTAADKFGGRGRKQLLQSPVKVYALEHNLPLLQPTNLKDEDFLKSLASWEADIFVVVAFRMLPKVVWAMPPMGTVNLHGSLLPKYRGAAPINWAIINGEKESGVTTFMIDDKIDTGHILLKASTEILPVDTAGTLHDRLMGVGAQLMFDTLIGLKNNTLKPQPQDENEVTHAPKLFKHNTEIDPKLSGQKIINFIRGLSPYPGAWLPLEHTELKIFSAKLADAPQSDEAGDKTVFIHDKTLYMTTGDGCIEVIQAQIAGKRRMSGTDIANGHRSLFD